MERQELFAYAQRMLGPLDVARVRGHLAECATCRATLREYQALDAVLGEWQTGEPSPWFDARLHQRIAEANSGKAQTTTFGFRWTQWAALGSLVSVLILLSTGTLIVHHPSWLAHRSKANIEQVTVQKAPVEPATSAAKHAPPLQTPPSSSAGTRAVSSNEPSRGGADELSLDDYDLVSNFDLLSDLPKEDAPVAN